MKTQNNQSILKSLQPDELKRLAAETVKTEQPKAKIFSAADLWNIRRMSRTFRVRRYY